MLSKTAEYALRAVACMAAQTAFRFGRSFSGDHQSSAPVFDTCASGPLFGWAGDLATWPGRRLRVGARCG